MRRTADGVFARTAASLSHSLAINLAQAERAHTQANLMCLVKYAAVIQKQRESVCGSALRLTKSSQCMFARRQESQTWHFGH